MPIQKMDELLQYFHRLDHYKLAHRTLVQELDSAGNFGEERIVFAAADIEARLDARATLPHNDGSAGNQLPAERFHAQPLRV